MLGARRSKPTGGRPAASTPITADDEHTQARDEQLYDAVLKYRAGEFDAAEAVASRLPPDFFPPVLLRGMIAGKTGRPAEGIELLRAAIALNRRSSDARNELAILLRAQGRLEEATTEAKHAVRLEPQDAGSHNNLALCYLVSGRAPLAITHFTRAIALQPDAATFHHNLGLALQLQARDTEAMAAFRRALDLDPRHAEALARLGQVLSAQGRLDGAAQCYAQAAALQPDAALGAVHRAEGLMQQGRVAEAEACLTQAIADDPRSDLAHQVLGVLLQRRGRFEEASAVLRQAIELQPKRISAYLSLVQGKKIRPDDQWLIDRMLGLVNDPALGAPERGRLYYALGKACDDLSDYERAMRFFDRANAHEREQMRQAGRSFDRRRHKALIDRTIEPFAAQRSGPSQNDRSDSDLPILIVGMPRTGTTLVEQILSSHPEIGAAGELGYWIGQSVRTEAGMIGDSDHGRLGEDYLALLRAAAPDARRVTDKMPANFLTLGLVHDSLPNARIIHCRRHPVDTCLSIWMTPFGNPLDFAHDRADLIFFYRQYIRLMAHWRSLLPPDRLLEVDYEVLVAEPARTSRALVEFCGVTWDPACLHHEANNHIIMTPSLWQARQPIYTGAVERWRRYEPWLGAFNELNDDDCT